jgi:hypothetical protein
MAYDNSTEPGIRAARAAIRAAFITLATTTIPPLAATLVALVRAADPNLPMMAGNHPITNSAVGAQYDGDQALYAALCHYVDGLIAAGGYAGPALPNRN